jgi:catechol 2,3-dioxygenase-like lactoylglutathione lyase family enzyme
MVPTGSGLAEAVKFYTEHMGFSVLWATETMAAIRRDDVSFHLVENSNREYIENTSFSIGVADLQALYEEYRRIPTNVGALEVTSWGRREFHMIVPSGVCFQFYQQDGLPRET